MSATIHDYQVVLDFWFGHGVDDQAVIDEKDALWWDKSGHVDKDIRKQFGKLHEDISVLESWAEQPLSCLALIILADQFSRNLYRDTPLAFAQDKLALFLACEGIELSMDKSLRPVERIFFYMPLEHSELLHNQQKSVALFRSLEEEVAQEIKAAFAKYTDYAVRHWEIIDRFGRFPHRNAILNRKSSTEELEFLKLPGSSF